LNHADHSSSGGKDGPGFSLLELSTPCWLLAPLLALWPLTSLTLSLRRRTRRRRRLAMGCCLSCGYDLRATPAPGGALLAVCPECGAVAAASSTRQPPLL
jgi:hypothetical protein